MSFNKKPFTRDILKIKNVDTLVDKLAEKLKNDIFVNFKRRGAVIGISGGIDSSVTLALAVKALGADKVFGVMMPEKDSNPDSEDLATELARKFNIRAVVENISSSLKGFQCYERRDEAVKKVFPDFNPDTDKSKIVISNSSIDHDIPSLFKLVVIDSKNQSRSKILPLNEYLQIVAASNFKQRSRMSMVYYHAEQKHYVVLGTANKHEVDQGFFVKFGDGGADLYPLAGLYKTQVYDLAEYLGVTKEIIERTPTTDTYTAEQTQEEFFFQLPIETLGLLWYGYENGYSTKDVAEVVGKTVAETQRIFRNFERKKRTTDYLRANPVLYPGTELLG